MIRAALMVAVLLGAAASPASAWDEPMPGEAGWPKIPQGSGLSAFISKKWTPQCERMAYGGYSLQLTLDGQLIHDPYLASARQPWASERYRTVAESDSYVVMLVRKDRGGGQGEYRFWYLRPESVTDGVGVTTMRVGQCGESRRGKLPAGKSWHPDFLHDGVWAMGDTELRAYWGRHECNPTNTGKTKDQPFWGEGWDQVCPYLAPSPDGTGR